MRGTLTLILAGAICLCGIAAVASEIPFSLGVYGGGQTLRLGDVFAFKTEATYGARGGFQLGSGFEFGLDVSFVKLGNDEDKDSTAALGTLRNDIPLTFKATRVGAYIEKKIWNAESRFNLSLGLGGGMLYWKMLDPSTDSIYQTVNNDDRPVQLKASELILSPQLNLHWQMMRRISWTGMIRGDYLTGGGVDFAEAVESARDRWLFTAALGLNFHIGSRGASGAWQDERAEIINRPRPQTAAARTARDRDSDADGITDDKDRCASTRAGAVVDKNGCPLDSDGDGVYDGLDDCPDSPREALGLVDINGCPVDSDFDGVPDYLDACPSDPVGAQVDARGCPLDGDKDGVPDGLDDCPSTLAGAQVDRHGCMDLKVFDQPMLLYIDYPPGSFEVDNRNKERLQKLATLLQVVPDITLEVLAYSDDIGTEVANLKLSEKRANRVRDFLVAYGVATDRIRPVGKGEVDPVASNQTAEGRAKNRRIEIIFHK
uniref:OmpA-like domain-containing protein n=1 Tax=uncultured bacterium pAW1 TaxID=1781155 RepID=A0A1C9U4Q3_9BACT|nr:hypothetical protein [uncultured bacterium pAW1]